MWRSRRSVVVSVLAAGVVGALVALLVLQPWNTSDRPAPRYTQAAVAANGYECASIGRSVFTIFNPDTIFVSTDFINGYKFKYSLKSTIHFFDQWVLNHLLQFSFNLYFG